MTTKKRLTRVAPLRAGTVLAILYGVIGIIIAPFFLFAALASREGAVEGIALAVGFPIVYAMIGFIGGVIGAALYNLVAKWTGGLEFEVSDETAVA